MNKVQLKVKDLMQDSVYAVSQDDMIDRVFFLLHYEKIRHLPVVKKGKVVGIVTDRDLYKALGPKSNSNGITKVNGEVVQYFIPRKVRNIMHRGVITIEPDENAALAASLMAEQKVGALPVVHKGKLAGIITATDILKVFAEQYEDA